jgi:4'-phosphopantetheinyl transferase
LPTPRPDAIAVDVYWASLDVDAAISACFSETLSDAEHARVALLGDAVEGRWRLAELGLRRALLAAQLGCTPAEIAYVVSPDRKPSLAGGPHFSVSKAGPIALYAVCGDAEVGVDIEPVPADPTDPALERLARRLLTPRERAAYAAASLAERPDALAAFWTRKEAHGKALGTGLRFPLTEIEVWAGDDRPVRVGDVVVHTVDVSETDRGGGPRRAAAVAVVAAPGRPVSIPRAPVRLDPATLPR